MIAGALLALALACGGGQADRRSGGQADKGSAADSFAAPAREAAPDSAAPPAIVFLGTSLTAGLGLDPDSAYPALLQQKLDSAGFHYRVVNAGVSGESSAGALRRLDWVLGQSPAILVIETGANDGLRGQDPDSIRANIQAMIDRTRERSPGTTIVLAAMEAMPNLGEAYVRRFRAIYPDLARANHLALLPFLLDRVAGVDSLNQQDGIHPNQQGERLVADNVYRGLLGTLRRAGR
jgi:acyl-CoA thioesterase-1